MSSPPSKDLEHFKGIPWTKELLSDPGLTLIHPVRPRVLKESTEDQLFADLFSQPDTIGGILSFHRTPSSSAHEIPEVTTLFDLGYRLNGYPGVAHGGLVVTIIDESMGIFLSRNQEVGAFSPGASRFSVESVVTEADGKADRRNDWQDVMTADLRVKFLKPVKTPQVVRIDVRLARREGRKFYVEADLKDEQGTVLAKGDALWIALKAKL